jgi:uncharacterized protein YjbI with pentapeptide repeats
LHWALLTRATFLKAAARHARFDGGELSRCDFREADLRGSRFSRCSLKHATLTGSRVDGASFNNSNLDSADLTSVTGERASFVRAALYDAILSSSILPRADFRGAFLLNTGLAQIDWEGADLRDADFAGASFHYGSSRSGLVNSFIAGEGSKTGFYTDEYLEQDFKAPEEIRKANLCGSDLRGAKVEGVDWYLVDLRGALYTPDQAAHFARCGAILHTRS